jgi:hypothetical protein
VLRTAQAGGHRRRRVVRRSGPRTCAAGAVIFGGHVGTIYQATNGIYVGRSTPRRLRLLPDGSVLSDRAIAKLRAGHKGEKVARKLVESGADELTGDRIAWTQHWLAKLTRAQRHGGCHKYAWGLKPSLRQSCPHLCRIRSGWRASGLPRGFAKCRSADYAGRP